MGLLTWLRTTASFLALGVCADAAAGGLDFLALKQLITQQQLGSIETLLARLPAAFRAGYVLVFDSRSLQQASFSDPRAILFGDDARFILTFNGAPSQRGFDTLETMEFDADGARFVLREIEFRHSASGAPPEVIYSQDNPEKCTVCHGNPPRPVWDAYPSWPGIYGEQYLRSLTQRERRELAQFSARHSTHPRYRNLFYAERYARPETFRPDTREQYQGSLKEPPNSILTTLLGQQNLVTISVEIQRSERFNPYRYALLASLNPDCDLDDSVPARIRASYRTSFSDFAERARQSDLWLQERKAVRSLSRTPARATESLSRFRYLVEEGLGLSTAQWTMALEKNTFDFSMKESAATKLETLLLAVVAATDPDIRNLREAGAVSHNGRYCAYLRRNSVAALDAMHAAGPR